MHDEFSNAPRNNGRDVLRDTQATQATHVLLTNHAIEFKEKAEGFFDASIGLVRWIEDATTQAMSDWDSHDQPDSWKAWGSAVFQFVRKVKSAPAFDSMKWKQAWTLVAKIAAFISPDFWEDKFQCSAVDMEQEFFRCWDKVKVRDGESWIDTALAQAKKQHIDFPQSLVDDRADSYLLFVEMCYWLQADVGSKGVIYISCRKWGLVLRADKGTVSKYRKQGVADGFLGLVRKFNSRSMADEFRFNMTSVQLKTEAENDSH